MNMKHWVRNQIEQETKKPLPVLTFPAIQPMGITVNDLISSSDLQAKAMKLIVDKTDMPAALSMMDLSVEAEAFGSTIRFSDDEVPTVIGTLVNSKEDAENMVVPPMGTKRTGIYVEGVKKARELITDRPVIGGIIGPFSLAGRLLDVSKAMVKCITDPVMVQTVLKKTTQFLIEYAQAYKDAGAQGIVMAEPLAGLLSPKLAGKFSGVYVKEIVDAVQDDDFIVIYHNCGNSAVAIVDSIIETGAAGYHFGNAIDMAKILPAMPEDVLVMGNIDPAGQFKNGTPESVYLVTQRLLAECSVYPNFIISSGCDIPPTSSWDNIMAFFKATQNYYSMTPILSSIAEYSKPQSLFANAAANNTVGVATKVLL